MDGSKNGTAKRLEAMTNEDLYRVLERTVDARRALKRLLTQVEAEIGARQWDGTWKKVAA